MMSAPRNPVEIRQDVRRALTTVEAAALAHIEQQIAAGKPVTQLSVQEAVGSKNSTGSTGTGILNRLEEKGYIYKDSRQRAVRVCITDNGECTIEPKDKSTHWLKRADRVPSPSLQAMRDRAPSLMQWAEKFARAINMPLAELTARAAVVGLESIRDEQTQGEVR